MLNDVILLFVCISMLIVLMIEYMLIHVYVSHIQIYLYACCAWFANLVMTSRYAVTMCCMLSLGI